MYQIKFAPPKTNMTMTKNNRLKLKMYFISKMVFVFIAMLVYLEGETHDNPQLAVFMS